MNTTFLGFAVLIFVATVLLIEGLYLYWNGRHGAAVTRVKARVGALRVGNRVNGEPLSIMKDRSANGSALAGRLLNAVPRIEMLEAMLRQSGLSWSLGRLVGYMGVFAGVGAMVGLVMHLPFPFLLGLAALCGTLPLLHVRGKRSKRIAVLERQLPDAADLVGRAMLAGHSFPSALGMVGEEMPQPLGGEFKIAFDEINFGVSMNDALLNMVKRVPVDDLRYFVIAVLIQRDAGGNLAEILGNISTIIRERLKLLGKVRVLSAEGRLSAWILCLLPFVLTAVIWFLNPALMRIFWTDPTGMKVAGAALLCMLFGIIWTRKLVQIRV
ncbi:type II secretion system F family protein [Paraburkholderia sp. DHOC27]|uniref:type II secretion system F family protein n=1 Tax=Paraburkholderia sp. DHOC27 TaxID=2303330 RepID=UPI000E3DA1C6|nr:type II secretion system F family protein [Paraburkholderia sp. DHOC27]RFU44616.1 pilus assembly protein TadB [Paraburkholderia sp. DHOC27]